ncbi:MAG: hypothetical protein LBE12_16260 [Planctomycetaceae bacterium]|jgi:hypothetical protein|nr:hypothetical protein [Planctomycetaceae bacterium]
MIKKNFIVLYVIGVIILFGTGCQENLVQIKGVCTYNDEPVEDVIVTFVPQEDKPSSSALIQKEGKFLIVYKAGVNGIHTGQYSAFFDSPSLESKPNKAGAALIKKYAHTTTGLPFSVSKSSNNYRWDITD